MYFSFFKILIYDDFPLVYHFAFIEFFDQIVFSFLDANCITVEGQAQIGSRFWPKPRLHEEFTQGSVRQQMPDCTRIHINVYKDAAFTSHCIPLFDIWQWILLLY